MTLVSIALNGTPIEDDGLVLASEDGLRAFPKKTFTTVTLARIAGERVLSERSSTDVRRISLRFLDRPSSFTDRTTKLDAIFAKFRGPVSITLVDAPTRALVGRLEAMTLPVVGANKPFAIPEIYPDLQIVCHDPYYYDTTPVTQTIAAGAAAGAVSVGTADTGRRLAITVTSPSPGPATNPVVILRNQSAVELQRMTLTGVLYPSATATALQPVSIAIDCDAWTLVGTRKNGTTFDATSWLGRTETPFELVLSDTVTGFTLECAQADLAVSHYRAYAG